MIFLTLFLEFFKIGLFTIGGGYAMIPLLEQTVNKYGWLSGSEFLDMIGLSEITPGPIAINMATYIGSIQGGQALGFFGSILGSLIATLAVVLPAFIIMLLIAIFLKKLMKNKYVQGALKGIRPVAFALIFTAGIFLFSDFLTPINNVDGQFSISANKIGIFIFMLIAFAYFVYRFVSKKKVSPILLILSSAIIGIVVNYLLLIPA